MTRNILSDDSPNHVPPLVNWQLQREGATEWSFPRQVDVLLIGRSFSAIKEFFDGLNRERNINRNGDFMFLTVASDTLLDNTEQMVQFFRQLWKDFDIFKSLVVALNGTADGNLQSTNVTLGYYRPFEFPGGRNDSPDDEANWGQFHWRGNYKDLDESVRSRIRDKYVGDFHGFPLKVNQFIRYPTAIPSLYIPTVVRKSYVYGTTNESGKSSVGGMFSVNNSFVFLLPSRFLHRSLRSGRTDYEESRDATQFLEAERPRP